jgi:hypothetical protein
MDLKPGPYLLISRVTDVSHPADASPSAAVLAEFEILPRR